MDFSPKLFRPLKNYALICDWTGNVNNNAVLGSSVFLVVLGLISYIIINKKIAD